MKKLIYLSLAALMVLAVSCGKDNKPGNTGEPELIVPDVMSDLVIGEQTFPIRTFNARHALAVAGLKDLYDGILFGEEIASVPKGYYNPACVPLGDGSLQDLYDQMVLKSINALFIITDKELNAGDYTFYDELPVGILPESALDVIRPAIVHFSEDGDEYDYVEAAFKPRENLFSPAVPIVGKQWVEVSVGDASAAFLDINHFFEGKVYAFLLSYGLTAYPPAAPTYEVPHKFQPKEGDNFLEFRAGESDTEFAYINSQGVKFGFKAVCSLGKDVLVQRVRTDPSGNESTIAFIFVPVPYPVVQWPYEYDLMVSVDGKDYPLSCSLSTNHDEQFLALGKNVPFLFLDAVGNPEDFEGKDVHGKIVGVNRGGITFIEKQLNAKNAGAVALICVNNQEGLFRAEIDKGSIPFGIADLNIKSVLQNASAISLVPFHTLEE